MNSDHRIEELRTALRSAIDYLMNRHEADEIFMRSIRDVLQRTTPECSVSEEIPYKAEDDPCHETEIERFEDERYDRPAEADEPREIEDEDIPY